MKKTVMLYLVFLIAAAVDVISAADDGALPTDLPSGPEFNIDGLTINEADLLMISEEESIYDHWESMAERKKKCSPSISCELIGGYCIKSRKQCDGTIDPNGCIGNKKCSCCIPEKTTPAPLTCPPIINVTCPAVTITPCPTTEVETTAAPPTCPQTTCPTCPSTAGCDKPCSKGTRVGSLCLEVSVGGNTWHNAKSACAALGGQLAVLSGLADPFDVLAWLTETNGHSTGLANQYWVGASKLSGSWKWIDGVGVSDSLLWGCYQPSGGEDCMSIINNYGINDAGSGWGFRYICQFDSV